MHLVDRYVMTKLIWCPISAMNMSLVSNDLKSGTNRQGGSNVKDSTNFKKCTKFKDCTNFKPWAGLKLCTNFKAGINLKADTTNFLKTVNRR